MQILKITTMKPIMIVKVICIAFLFCACSGQNQQQTSKPTADKSREAYEYVIQQPMSTSPHYVVVTLKDMNTGAEKEMCMEIGHLYWLCSKIVGEDVYVYDYMQQNSETRVFEVKDKDVLSEIGFYDYKLIEEKEINNIVKSGYLDSLAHISDFTNTVEEMYANEEIDFTKEMSKTFHEEFYRLESKFLNPYIKKYDLNFCHVMFNYGVVFRRGCLDGGINFDTVIK